MGRVRRRLVFKFVSEEIMRHLIAMVVALGVVVSVSVAAQNPPQQNWTGKISDSNC